MIVTTAEDGSGDRRWQVFQLADHGRLVTRLPVPPERAAELSTLLDPTGSGRSCHLLVLVRPWLSMRKYGERGYLYAHLDAGHAGANLLGSTPSAWRPVLRLALDTSAIRAAAANAIPAFHEIHSVLSFEPDHAPDPVPVAVRVPLGFGSPPDVDPLEALCWTYLVGTLQQDGVPAPEAREPGAASYEAPDSWQQWRRWAAARRSCRRFGGARLDSQALLRTLSTLGTRLPFDLGTADTQTEVRATLVLGPGYAVGDEMRARLGEYGTVADWPDDPGDDLVRACRNQEHTGRAQVFVLLHLPEQRILVEGQPHLLRVALFRAGCAAHLIQIGAAGAQVAVSTIGRFDHEVWTRAGRLTDSERVLYLLALGTEEETT